MSKSKLLIFSNKNCKVFKVTYLSTNEVRCKKVLVSRSKEQINRYIKEINMLSYLRDTSCCVRYYDAKIKVKEGTFQASIYMEYCERGNLSRHLMTRQRDRRFYTDSELFDQFLQFINLFSSLQEKEISHRDIKPENIFITGDGLLKIGDFGSAIVAANLDLFTIQGSPFYLSPELRQGYEMYMKRQGGIKIKHDPYKSDVYSLGLVFLFMATLIPITEELTDLSILDRMLAERLELVKNWFIKDIISKMLEFHNDERPNFFMLKEKINEMLSQDVCRICIKESGNARCARCGLSYHLNCAINKRCISCSVNLVVLCQRCKNNYGSVVIQCGHSYCLKCRVENKSCMHCIGFHFLEDDRHERVKLPELYTCINCKKIMNLQEERIVYECDNCNYEYCAICKRYSHKGHSCLENEERLSIHCKCSEICEQNAGEDIFFLCSKCTFRCLVCFRNLLGNHVACSTLYQNPQV